MIAITSDIKHEEDSYKNIELSSYTLYVLFICFTFLKAFMECEFKAKNPPIISIKLLLMPIT